MLLMVPSARQLRAVLLERGIVVPKGRRKLERYVDALLADREIRLSLRTGLLIEDMRTRSAFG